MKAHEEWLWLRGLTREQAHWGDFRHAFARQFPGAGISCLDLPGCGKRHKENSPISVTGIVKKLREPLEEWSAAHNPERKRILLAISFGGLVALEILRHKPDLFSGLVIINSSVSSLSAPWQRLKPPALLQLLPWFWQRNPLMREEIIYRLTSNNSAHEKQRVAEWAEILRQRPISSQTVLAQLCAAGQYRPQWTRVPRLPTLILTSRGDRLVSHRCSESLARLLKADIEIHPTAGHDLPLDEPKWVCEKIHNWRQTRLP